MKKRLMQILRRVAERFISTQRYRILRAHLWNDAVQELQCGGRCA